MNRKAYYITFLAAVLFFATGCNKNTPKDVAKDWLVGFYHMDFDPIKKLSTAETRELVNTFEAFTAGLPDSVRDKAKKVQVIIKKVKIEGNNATDSFTASVEAKDPAPLKMVNQNGQWLVEFSKSDWMGNNDPNAAAAGSPGGFSIEVGTPGSSSSPAVGDSANMTTPDTAKH